MKRFLRAAALAALAILPLAHPASANLRLITKNVNWLNQNRLTSSTSGVNSPDTLYNTFHFDKIDSSVVFSVGDLVPPPWVTGAAADSARHVVARVWVVSDSAVAPTADSIRVTIQGVAASLAEATVANHTDAGVTINTRILSTLTAGRTYALPVLLGNGAGASISGSQEVPLFASNWRVILSGILDTSKIIGKMRLMVSYYVDQ